MSFFLLKINTHTKKNFKRKPYENTFNGAVEQMANDKKRKQNFLKPAEIVTNDV